MRNCSFLASILTAGVVAAGLLAGCVDIAATTGGAAVVASHPPVPAPVAEFVPKPPVSAEALIWQPGYWDWTGAGYEWRAGRYIRAAGQGNMWAPGYWEDTPGGWAWRPPHWTS
jgi:hypothetical protein